MSNLLARSVTKAEDGYAFACPGVIGSPCGSLVVGGSPYASTGWPTKRAALDRGAQHFAEHRGEGVMQPLHEFRADHGLGVTDDGRAVALSDL